MKPILAAIIGFTFALCPAFAAPRADVKPNVKPTPKKPTRPKPTPKPAMQLAPFVSSEGFIYMPRGASNVAVNRPVTSSSPAFSLTLRRGDLTNINDGGDNVRHGVVVVLDRGTQWVQIDLQSPFIIHGVRICRGFFQPRTYRDVIIQLADDARFTTNVRTVFNNDRDNSSGLGKGKDREYSEDEHGYWIPLKAQKAAAVRFYSRGSSAEPTNEYAEIEVWATVAPGLMKASFVMPRPLYGSWLRVPKPTNALPHRNRGPVYLPVGASNVASNKPVFSSDDAPIIGALSMITDGDKEAEEGSWIELGSRPQWVQIDLQQPFSIHGVLLWHYWADVGRVYRDVIIQLADDKEFKNNVRTVFNNDDNNSSGLGKGNDREFYEDRQGQWIPINAQTARYVRLYSNGNTSDPQNQYVEVEVWATDVKPKSQPQPQKAQPHATQKHQKTK